MVSPDEKCIIKKTPVRIWIRRVRPSSDPKFQQAEMFEGVGRSIRVWLISLISGWDFRSWWVMGFYS